MDRDCPFIMSTLHDKHIHLVSFDIPFPPDYGGIIDVYYKIKALNDSGIKVHLHCFEYGRAKSSELEMICYQVNYYKRELGLKYFFNRVPYIVVTRQNTLLFNNLLKDDYPIIYEGLHTCIFAGRDELKNRIQIVRMHNIESKYYNSLSDSSISIVDKIFFKMEAFKLNLYEKSLGNHLSVAVINEGEADYYKNRDYNIFRSVTYIPPFHENSKVISLPGRGNYVLYHGNLSVSDNEQVVLFILNKIFSGLQIPLIIAGKNPTKKIIKTSEKFSHVKVIGNPDSKEMNSLLINAHINLLPAINANGMKLKLLNSLYKGRFCVVNDLMVRSTGLEDMCYIANNKYDYHNTISELFTKDFTVDDLNYRKSALTGKYSNLKSAGKLLKLLKYD